METENVSGVSLQEYLLILRRRLPIILQAFVLVTIIGVVVTLTTKPVYQSSAQLLVDAPSMSISTVDSSNPLNQIFNQAPPPSVPTQVAILQSPALVGKVLQQTGPAQISVSTMPQTNIIEVDAEAADPQVAAAAANTLLKTYITQNVDQSLDEMKTAYDFAKKQQAAARTRLTKANDQIAAFQKRNKVVDLNATQTEQIGRVNSLNGGLIANQTQLAALRAQIAATQSALSQEPATIARQTQATNTQIAALKANIAALQVQRTAITQKGGFTETAPQVISLDAQLKALNSQLREQEAAGLTKSETVSPNTVRDNLKAKLTDAKAQEASLVAQGQDLSAKLATAKAQVGNLPAWQMTLGRLYGERDAASNLDKTYSDKLNDLSLRQQAHHSPARIFQMAYPNSKPVRPKKLQSILFAALIGLFVGICLALLQEFMDDRINSVEDANRLLGLPQLGHVPALSGDDARLLPKMKGMDPAAESYRILRTNIQFASVDAPARTLLVTSANPGEGKTTTAANLAFAMAMDGKKVILVDTDLRRPTLHKLLNLPSLPGLTDILLGRASLAPQEVMPGLHVLTAGSTPPNPGELLNSRTFRHLVETLMEQADLVIFDSPPVLAGADAAILASQMDGTILVVETGSTKKATAKRATQILTHVRANMLGVAYNKMRAKEIGGFYYQYQYGTATLEDSRAWPHTLLPAGSDGEKPDFHAAGSNSHVNGSGPADTDAVPMATASKEEKE